MVLTPGEYKGPKVGPGYWARAARNMGVSLRFLAGPETDTAR